MSIGIGENIFIECDMTRKKNTPRRWIIAARTLVVIGWAKIDTREGTRFEFVFSSSSDVWKTEASEDAKRRVIRMIKKKGLERGVKGTCFSWADVEKKGGGAESFCPKSGG